MKTPTASAAEVEKKSINGELWQACAGPLVTLPAAGSHVVYFPQGHSEQVAASMRKDADAQIPSYPNLPSKLLCFLHSVTLHADPETDEVYAQMTLQPVPSYDKDALLRSDLSTKSHKPQTEFFCKTLTASDTSTHGGFSVPRRAAEKIFPPLDFTMQPPAQELVAKDLHDNSWTFRHIYRGQPKRHLLTTGWSPFVSGKRLFTGDSVLFIRDEKRHQLLLGIRRAQRQPTNLSSSVLSSDSMHIGILAAAAHAAANNSPFTVYYNPRASPSEFVIPLAKYYKATCSNQISLGMRFRMVFETEESGTRRYMGTITGISDMDPVRWKNSQWRNLQVGWDESTVGERRNRVSIWEIEPVIAPFFICPTPNFFHPKRPRQIGMPDDDSLDLDSILRRTMPWIGDEFGLKDSPGLNLVQWMNMQQNSSPMQTNYMSSFSGSVMQMGAQQNSLQFNRQMPIQQNAQQLDQVMSSMNPLGSVVQNQQKAIDVSESRQNLIGQSCQVSSQILNSQSPVQVQNVFQHQQIQRNHSQSQQQNLTASENQVQMQLFQKLQQQQQLPMQMLDASNFHGNSQQTMNSTSQNHLPRFPQPHHAGPTLDQPINSNHLSAATDDIPSCSTSPSTNNVQSLVSLLNPGSIETAAMPDLHRRIDVKPSTNLSKTQGYLNNSNARVDYLDSSSSATSIVSQNDVRVHPHPPINNSASFDSHSMLRDDGEVYIDPRDSIPFVGSGNTNNTDMRMPENVFGGGVLSGYENHSEAAQAELSSSMVSHSFGVPDMGFNSIDSTIKDDGFMNRGAWAPPQIPRMRTYTKVYKRGAVGRLIDITRYSGYDELKQDLASKFGIEGQLEEKQRVGWKLVYVDNEKDVLLVGDDPWGEFVNCVRCIKILSPLEVQQMSLDGGFGSGVLPNHACSSSDNGVG